MFPHHMFPRPLSHSRPVDPHSYPRCAQTEHSRQQVAQPGATRRRFQSAAHAMKEGQPQAANCNDGQHDAAQAHCYANQQAAKAGADGVHLRDCIVRRVIAQGHELRDDFVERRLVLIVQRFFVRR